MGKLTSSASLLVLLVLSGGAPWGITGQSLSGQVYQCQGPAIPTWYTTPNWALIPTSITDAAGNFVTLGNGQLASNPPPIILQLAADATSATSVQANIVIGNDLFFTISDLVGYCGQVSEVASTRMAVEPNLEAIENQLADYISGSSALISNDLTTITFSGARGGIQFSNCAISNQLGCPANPARMQRTEVGNTNTNQGTGTRAGVNNINSGVNTGVNSGIGGTGARSSNTSQFNSNINTGVNSVTGGGTTGSRSGIAAGSGTGVQSASSNNALVNPLRTAGGNAAAGGVNTGIAGAGTSANGGAQTFSTSVPAPSPLINWQLADNPANQRSAIENQIANNAPTWTLQSDPSDLPVSLTIFTTVVNGLQYTFTFTGTTPTSVTVRSGGQTLVAGPQNLNDLETALNAFFASVTDVNYAASTSLVFTSPTQQLRLSPVPTQRVRLLR